jgi:hypothetical protein
MPDGLDLTLPEPVPVRVTVRTGFLTKAALTDLAPLIVTLHAPVPLQSPDHAANSESKPATAARDTTLPVG